MIIRFTTLFILLSSSLQVFSQQVSLPYNSRAQQILERWEIMAPDSVHFHAASGAMNRTEAGAIAMRCATDPRFESELDQADVQYMLDENILTTPEQTVTTFGHRKREKPFLKYFYETPANLFSINKPDFRLVVNPLLNFRVGVQNGDSVPVFHNERGFQVYGDIANRISFYSSLQEIQARYPATYTRWIAENKGYPGATLVKSFQSSVLDKAQGVDYNIAEAYIKANLIKQVQFTLGHGRHFIGNGYRSMLLSDFAPVYFYARLDTRVWKLHYTNLFTEMGGTLPFDIVGLTAKKHMAAHYLDYHVNKKWTLGIYEATIFSRSGGFEAQYFNPVILYRSVEGTFGSPDNVIVGLNTKYNIGKTAQVYGQLLLDEFLFAAIYNPDERGWWANKAATQIGVKYINAFKINKLDLQLEFNTVRPYTYSHQDSLTSYTHYGQPLAHPLGANFREVIGILKYQPTDRIGIEAKYFRWKRGHNAPGLNFGGDPWQSYNTRQSEYGNFIGQGFTSNVQTLTFDISYRLAHNVYLDLNAVLRNDDSALLFWDRKVNVWSAGIRWNAWKRREEL